MVACHMHVAHSALTSLMTTITLCLLRTYYNQLGSQPLLTARCAVVQRCAAPPCRATCVGTTKPRTLKAVAHVTGRARATSLRAGRLHAGAKARPATAHWEAVIEVATRRLCAAAHCMACTGCGGQATAACIVSTSISIRDVLGFGLSVLCKPLLTARCAVVQRRATPPRWAACVCAVERRTLKTVTLGVRTRAARCR